MEKLTDVEVSLVMDTLFDSLMVFIADNDEQEYDDEISVLESAIEKLRVILEEKESN